VETDGHPARPRVRRAAALLVLLALLGIAAASWLDHRRDVAAERAVELTVKPARSYLGEGSRWVVEIVSSGPDRVVLVGARLGAPGFPRQALDAPMGPGDYAQLPGRTGWGCPGMPYDGTPETIELDVRTHRGTMVRRSIRLSADDAAETARTLRFPPCGRGTLPSSLEVSVTGALRQGKEVVLELQLRNVDRFNEVQLSDLRTLHGLVAVSQDFPLQLRRGEEVHLPLVLVVKDCDALRRAGLGTRDAVTVHVDNDRDARDETLPIDAMGDHQLPGEAPLLSGTRLIQEYCRT